MCEKQTLLWDMFVLVMLQYSRRYRLGSYGCIATNPFGQASIEIFLTVLPGTNLDLQREVATSIETGWILSDFSSKFKNANNFKILCIYNIGEDILYFI